jgi:hypothetical protein
MRRRISSATKLKVMDKMASIGIFLFWVRIHKFRYICVFKGTQQLLNKNWFSIPVGLSFIFENLDHSFYIGSGLDARDLRTLEDLGISRFFS